MSDQPQITPEVVQTVIDLHNQAAQNYAQQLEAGTGTERTAELMQFHKLTADVLTHQRNAIQHYVDLEAQSRNPGRNVW